MVDAQGFLPASETPEQQPVVPEAVPEIVEVGHEATEATPVQEAAPVETPTEQPAAEPVHAQAEALATPEVAKDQIVEELKSLLTNDLDPAALALIPEGKQAEFEASAEETAQKIKLVISHPNFKPHDVLEIVRELYKWIPGLSKYFIEQESKNRLDKIIDYAGVASGKSESELSV